MSMRVALWGKDMAARARVASRLVDGKLGGRRLIEYGTRISGGIYVSQSERLAITVDGASPEISSLYQRMLGWAKKDGPLEFVEQNIFLNLVCTISGMAIKTDGSNYMQTFEGFIKASDHIMSLDDFIKIQIGDCRVFGLLSGVLAEKLSDDNLILGGVSIDRNSIKGEGGHAWARFEHMFGGVTIIDATNNYVGDEEGGPWVYKRG